MATVTVARGQYRVTKENGSRKRVYITVRTVSRLRLRKCAARGLQFWQVLERHSTGESTQQTDAAKGIACNG